MTQTTFNAAAIAASAANAAKAAAPSPEAGSNEALAVSDTPQKERMFQEFKCARRTQRVVLPNGGLVNFYDHRYLTSEPGEIDYMTGEIRSGNLPGFEIGEVLASSDLDPMNKIRRQVLREFASLSVDNMAEQLKGLKDFGNSDAGQNLVASASMADKLSKLAAMLNEKKAK